MILQTNNLTLEYPGKLLCRNLSLTIYPGECWAILGQNGCGKRTLLHALAGLNRGCEAIGASIMVSGKAPRAWPGVTSHAISGFCCRKNRAISGAMCMNTYCWGGIRIRAACLAFEPWTTMATQAIERMELAALAARPLVTLSGASVNARALHCCLPSRHNAVAGRTSAISRSAPSSGTMALFRELARQGKAVVMVLHDLGWASHFCDHVLMLFDDGRTIAGPRRQYSTGIILKLCISAG